jgi:beta-xylosidase
VRPGRWLALLGVLLAAAACAGERGAAQPAVRPTFTNPVLAGNFADPFLLEEGGNWYAYATGDLVDNIQVARSADLVHWSRLPDALPRLPVWEPGSKGLTWAPEVARVPAGFVMYYTGRAAELGRQCISVAVAQRPEGPFTDDSAGPLVCQRQLGGSIDPHRFVDADGVTWLLWKNDGNAIGRPTDLWAQRLSGDGLKVTGTPRRLGLRNDQPWEGDLIEAPTVVREGGTYYLIYSANSYDSERYAVGYATAPALLGPWTKAAGNPVLRSAGAAAGPGGQSVVETGGRRWLAYHAWGSELVGDAQGGQRSLWLDRLELGGGKARVAGPTDRPQAAP